MPDPTLPESLTHGLPVRGTRAVLLDTLAPLEGRRVADIGCGDGTWTRFLSENGADVVGLDPNRRQLDRTLEVPPVAQERYFEAGAEALPLEDASRDIALFFNSLHHVPGDLMASALGEAARITRRGGMVVAFEPVARGSNFVLNRALDDETEVRALAHRRLHEAADGHLPLALEREFEYVTVTKKRDFAAWKDWQVRISPARAARFAADEDGLRAHFERVLADLPRDEEGHALLDQPMRATILRRT
ncbi:class I SAM-dependent methyltransferase [Rhodospira trueperi]|uniref:Methyltransferase domain-containing protein n=1 Tax=Rhodospira trueperi TaxID=69960 RepID=A0A1G6YV95_9PROT|nr:class I SAM-dependent methyltransferase [Rhodospira trueperi]SDD94319.1 Methyltransferase domain-containing protein [Rhodospira trueperi]